MDAPTLLGPGEGETLRPGFEIKVAHPQAVITESVYAPGQRGPDPHVHHHHSDGFRVLGGALEVRFDDELHELPAGSFALAPPDLVHSFRNPGPGEARFLNLHTPGCGFEEYLRSGFKAPFDQHPAEPGSGLPASAAVRGEVDTEAVRVREADAVELDEDALDVVYVLAGGPQLAANSCLIAPLGHAPAVTGASRLLHLQFRHNI